MLRDRDVVKRVSAILAVIVVIAIGLRTGPIERHEDVSVSVRESDAPPRSLTPTLPLTPTTWPKTITIAGHVVDESDHSAIANAEVLFRGELGEATAQTKADGSFSLETAPGDYRVAVRASGVVTAGFGDRIRLDAGPTALVAGTPDETLMPAVHAAGDIANLELPVTASARITGRVIDTQSHQVAHAIVRARGALRSALGTDSTETDDKGEFALEVPAGRYALEARAPGFTGLASPIEVTARARVQERVALMVTRGCEIRGKVVRADGSPAADGAIERLQRGSFEFGPTGRVDPDGTFVWITTEESEVTLRAWPWKSMPTEARTFQCHDGAHIKDVVLHVPNGQPAMAGTIVDANGDPVPFAYVDVEAFDVGHQSQQERADASGRFEVYEMWAGRYQITASAAGRGIAVTTVALPRSEDIKLQLAGIGRIEGTTTSLANGTLSLWFDACFDALDLQKRPMQIAREPRLVTVTGGRFTIEDAPACDLQLHARWRDQTIAARVVVAPAAAGHLELAIGPPHDKTVHGVVVDRGGSPVPNARVTAQLGEHVATATTDDDGHYTLRTFSGAAIAAGNGTVAGHTTVGRANVGDERVDLKLDQPQ